ncbi:hypothetical protein M422DRAFT_163235 [Sphaerobolus stellatus SS14]|uniref:Uncharacterized protein n=1 Tax=Sphaerobolus stellatus (strain SS14) TaxID=990650 RepID=A0A0C9W678_SPHS4|nr:hypothetical protein M422DRAFT_163235 [Sphaerobolus stellatus SS14]
MLSVTRPVGPPHLIFQITELCRHILRCLSTPDLYRFGASCKLIQMTVQEFISDAFNVNHRLKRFFGDPESFRKMQAETGTLVSGSFVLQLLIREYWLSSDLNLFIWPKQFEAVRDWVRLAGYSQKDSTFEEDSDAGDGSESEENINDETGADHDNGTGVDDDYDESTFDSDSTASLSSTYTLSNLVTVLFFEKKVKGKETLRIQIMVPEATPIQTILRLHSSMFTILSYYFIPVLIYSNI